MPPSGPRSRPARPAGGGGGGGGGASRNEVFENIFGRPAGGHHLGPSPHPSSSSSSSGYGGAYASPYPSNGGGGGTYLNPAQPSYPPGQVYAPPAPAPAPPFRQPQQPGHPAFTQAYAPVDATYPQRAGYEGSTNGTYGRAGGAGPVYASNLAAQPDNLPNRRASLAPSTYSTSSASYYSPNPDTVSPPPPRQSSGRLPPSSGYPAPPPPLNPSIWDPSRLSATSSSRLPPPNLTPAQAYQQSTGYGSAAPSPASVVFPHRAAASPMPQPMPNQSVSSFASGSTTRLSPSPSAPSASGHSSRSPPPTSIGEERLASPPPGYIDAIGTMFDGSGAGPLDAVPGIPRRGESSELSSLVDQWGNGQGPDDYGGRSSSQPPANQRTTPVKGGRQASMSSMSTASMHRRMASDSSIASSGYTMTSMNQRNHITPMSQIDASPDRPHTPTTPTGSEAGYAAHAVRRLSGRKSVESTASLPPASSYDSSSLPPGAAPHGALDNRSTSFSATSSSRKEAVAAVRSASARRPPSSFSHPNSNMASSQRSLAGTLNRSSSSARQAQLRAMPHIYPALLSRVAEAFKHLVVLSELVKDGITYKDSFDGRMAVGIIADIIKTPDRNLALLLGRALDAQKFFHDVTYDHRLRDNPNELYQFKERLSAPFMGDGTNAVTDSPLSEHAGLQRAASGSSGRHTGRLPAPGGPTSRPGTIPYTSDSGSIQTSDSQFSFSQSQHPTPATSSTSLYHPASSPGVMTKMSSAGSVPLALGVASVGEGEATGTTAPGEDDDEDLPQGVFTLLTDCYSPTCSRESLCYSINCPRRMEQMKRLNMQPRPGLTRKLSDESLKDVKETGTLWIHSVSQEILDSTSDKEKKRQECINELIYTERDFVRDLEYLRDSWVKPLRTQDIIAPNRREDFVQQVFWNVHDVLAVNHVLAERLTKRQKQQPVVGAIGDIFVERVPLFEPFVRYGAHQLFGKYEFEKEKGSNPAFQRFVDETERKPESRKLELNGYLTKPTTRLGRYPLLLEAVLKYTDEDHPDHKDLPEVIKMIRGFLTKVNIETGKSENIFELAQLEGQLIFRPNENIDLRLRDKSRELVHKGPLKRRGGNRDEIADLMGFLFDHAFLLAKPKWVNKAEQLRVYRRPIPLELLVVITPDDQYNSTKLSSGRNKLVARPSGTSVSGKVSHVPPKPESKHGFSLTIVHLGKKGYSMQLWVETHVSRKKWLESIDKQQALLREKSCVFTTETITEGYFGGLRKINCISPYGQGHMMIYGTDEGVYFSDLSKPSLREPVKVINLLDVTQVDVIEEFQLLIVLHERSVTTFPLDCLDPNDPDAALKRGKRISSHTSFFKSGQCLGKTLVAVVKSSTLSSTIKVLEPVDLSLRGKKPQGSFMKRLNGRDDALKLFKEFYIPTESSSVHFLKTKLCVGCTKGFEIVDLETLDMQGLLDPSDASLDFVLKRDNVRPIAIYRIEEDFLLCYDEFAFYVNKNGWRARPKWAIIWEGLPTAFALQYPYVIAFEPTFVEVRHVETGHLVQIIPGSGIQCLFADTPPSRVNAPGMQGRMVMYPPPGRPMYPQQQQQQGGGYLPGGYGGYPAGGGGGGGGRGGGYGGMPPPPLQPMQMGMGRYVRNQVIFTSDDGHVQFLKFPPPSQQVPQQQQQSLQVRQGAGGSMGHAPGHGHAGGGSHGHPYAHSAHGHHAHAQGMRGSH